LKAGGSFMKKVHIITVASLVLITSCAHVPSSTNVDNFHSEGDKFSLSVKELGEDEDVPLGKVDTLQFDIVRYVYQLEGLNFRGIGHYVPQGSQPVSVWEGLRKFGISPWSFRLPIDKPEPAIDSFVEYYRKSPKTLYHGVANAVYFAPVIVPALEAEGLPKELLFLPVIESGYNHSARSPKAAVGIWQFIEQTAERYGLIVDKWIDERRDPVKSSQAAAKYLKDLYEEFGDWELALAAYNAGEKAILKAILDYKASHPGTQFVTYWHIRKYLRKETQEYVPRFYAILRIIRQPEIYGFNLDSIKAYPIAFDTVIVYNELPLDTVALFAGVDLETIKHLNPQYKRGVVKPRGLAGAVVRLPVGQGKMFVENLHAYLASGGIASLSNDIRRSESVETTSEAVEGGVQLQDSSGVVAAAPPAATSAPPKELVIGGVRYVAYVVRNGDTLEKISRKYNLNQVHIMRVNKLTTTMLSPGQVLYLPADKLSKI